MKPKCGSRLTSLPFFSGDRCSHCTWFLSVVSGDGTFPLNVLNLLLHAQAVSLQLFTVYTIFMDDLKLHYVKAFKLEETWGQFMLLRRNLRCSHLRLREHLYPCALQLHSQTARWWRRLYTTVWSILAHFFVCSKATLKQR